MRPNKAKEANQPSNRVTNSKQPTGIKPKANSKTQAIKQDNTNNPNKESTRIIKTMQSNYPQSINKSTTPANKSTINKPQGIKNPYPQTNAIQPQHKHKPANKQRTNQIINEKLNKAKSQKQTQEVSPRSATHKTNQ